MVTQLAITCSKLTIETLEQGVKYVQTIKTPERRQLGSLFNKVAGFHSVPFENDRKPLSFLTISGVVEMEGLQLKRLQLTLF